MWNPISTRRGGDGSWWDAPPERMFEAYYMTLRVHYEMPAAQAYAYAKQHGDSVGVGKPGGVIGLMKGALCVQSPQ